MSDDRMRDPARDPEPPRFLSREAYLALMTTIQQMGVTNVSLFSTWRSDVRWGRNQIIKAGDWRDVRVAMNYGSVALETNQTDLPSLQDAAAWGTYWQPLLQGSVAPKVWPALTGEPRTFPATHIWSDATYNQTQDTRVEIAARLIAGAEQAGMLSAGYLGVEARSYIYELTDGRVEYVPVTLVQCSMTVRDPAGTSSGWAGRTSYDWGRIPAEQLAATALDKCLKSRSPVQIEPGRYTLIMEPQATFDLVKPLFAYASFVGPHPLYLSLQNNLDGGSPFHDTRKSAVAVSPYAAPEVQPSTKLQQRVFSEQVNLWWDPMDPDLGPVPFQMLDGRAYPYEPVQWVKDGVLTALGYLPGMTVEEMRRLGGDLLHPNGVVYTGSFRLDSGTTPPVTIDEMIATTTRGLLVTRFWDLKMVQFENVLLTGTTRDGLWLIENGKISHPVRNLRWTESPMFALNQVEQIGTAVPIFAPGEPPAMTSPLKVRDFSFTALEDAI